MKGLICAILAIVISILAAVLYKQPWFHENLFIVVPEPSGLAEEIKKVPVPTIGAEEMQALNQDGVMFIKGLVKGEELLSRLRRLMQHHAGMPFEPTPLNHKSWFYNGAARAVLRDGPVGPLLGRVLGEKNFLKLHESPIWGYPAHARVVTNGWHTDGRANTPPIMSIWMVLTKGAYPLQFVLGSHSRRSEIEEDCARPVPGAKQGFKEYVNDCITKWYSILEKDLGPNKTALFQPDLDAGDAFVFWGDTLHRGIRQTYPRLALSLRVGWSENHDTRNPCQPWHPLLFGPATSALKRDFDCSPWALLPGFPKYTPWLPFGKMTDAVLQLLTPFL
mmetsp:Transcript_104911/g.306418  ORF Transcript_104911/g.306418 Transcript_104911/m.306418 type:complete len:334 (-) Transcript_104911:67-1068(-)